MRPARSQIAARLVVFPHAGAGPNALLPIAQRMPEVVEVLGVTLPGRERRFGEPMTSDVGRIVAAVCAELNHLDFTPTLLFGHSMGASLAFAAALLEPGRCVGVAVSGQVPLRPPHALTATATDEQLMGLLRYGRGTADALLSDAFWRNHLLAVLRSDVGVAAAAADITATNVVDVPLLVLGGAGDEMVPVADLPSWAERTTAACRVRVLPGNHFFLLDPDNVTVLAEELGAAICSR